MNPLLAELERRWDDMFAALAAGDDLPPATRLRAEGLMEAAVILELSDTDALNVAMNRSYRAAFGSTLEDAFGADWHEFFAFPQIPAMAERAPVHPGTRE